MKGTTVPTDARGYKMGHYRKENANIKSDVPLDFGRKTEKALRLLLNPPKMDVGTTPSEVVFQDGKMRLLHYTPMVPKPHKVPLLVIYALVNKPYILDLQPDRSIIRRLLSEGIDIYMIDWGAPSEGDRFFTLDDYVNWYINDVVDFIRDRHGTGSISVLGYCMGGTLSVMFTALHPQKVKNLILMAAPLDFEKDEGLLSLWSEKEYFDVDKLVDTIGNVPGAFLNSGFLLLNPVKNLYSKYLTFIDKVDDEEFVELFFRMEKWIYDGIPVAGEAYREFMKNCYQQNLLVKSQLKLNGKKVGLRNLTMPLLNLVAQHDTLVPKESGTSFNDLVPSRDKETMLFKTGHIGMSVGSASHARFWPKVAAWLKKRSDVERRKSKAPGTKKTAKKRKRRKGSKRK